MSRASDDVLAERERQRSKWGDDHDDDHDDGALADAASYLAATGDDGCVDPDDPDELAEAGWAVQLRAKHKGDRRRQLVIAAALLLAEIERLDRWESEWK